MASLGRRSDDAVMHRIMHSSDIAAVFADSCAFSRKVNGKPCPNSNNCRNMFGSAEAQIAAVKSFRRKLWCIESEGNDAENQPRNKAKRLRRMLRSWSRKDIATGAIEIEYKVDMIVTCKSFCRRASGFTKNLFDSTVLAVLNPEESNTGVYLIERRERIKDAVEFLHNFFREPVNAEPDPAQRRQFKTFKKWLHIYNEDYIPHCRRAETKPLSYSCFVEARKIHCPNYVVSRKVKAGGWSHIECKTCTSLQDLIRDLEGDEQRIQTEALKRHRDYAAAHKDEYRHNRTKASDLRRQKFDMSMIIDGAGGSGTCNHPHVRHQRKGEPERHTLLKVRAIFTKIHGLGTVIHLGYPDLTSEGANLVLEIIYDAVKIYLSQRGLRNLRTIYIQADNVSYNKCWTLIAGLAALVELGIARKVKISYCIVSHTKEDIDAIIGNVVTHLRANDVPSFAVFKQRVMAAITKENAEVIDVKQTFDIPDYGNLFKNFAKDSNINGISKAHCIRITTDPETTKVVVHYKTNLARKGWYPRPVLKLSDDPSPRIRAYWDKFFFHDQYGSALKFEAIPLDGTDCREGSRQSWRYTVTYENDKTAVFVLPCPSLPVHIDVNDLLQSLPSVSRQAFRPQYFRIAPELKQKTFSLLGGRIGMSQYANEWTNFYDYQMPQSMDDSRFENIVCSLQELVKEYRGPVIIKKPINQIYEEFEECDLVDQITFAGGPINHSERRNILQSVGKDDTRKRKRKIADGRENEAPCKKKKQKRKFVDPEEYQCLVGTRHYDDEDKCTYEVMRIEVTKEGYVAAVRCRVNKHSTSKIEDLIFAEDALNMTDV